MTLAALVAALALHVGVPVSCAPTLPIAGTVGVYDVTNPAITLRTDVCERLALMANGARPTSLYSRRDFSEALWAAGHEWARAQGVNAEPASDCAGLPRMVTVARWLGVGRAYALDLQGFAAAALMDRGCR